MTIRHPVSLYKCKQYKCKQYKCINVNNWWCIHMKNKSYITCTNEWKIEIM